MFLRSILRI